jgi:hypothetical protein
MVLTSTDLDRITEWCATCSELEPARRAGWTAFFGTDEDGPVDYGDELGDFAIRQRRFLGWFMFRSALPDGSRPAEAAVHRVLESSGRAAAVSAVTHTRYVMAVVAAVMPGRGVLLELEDERFEVRSRPWAQLMHREAAVLAHLVPVRPGVWLPGPGWLEWPVRVGPHMRGELRLYQSDPIEIERVLQGRSRSETSDIERPRDATLAEAVARMTEAARSAGRPGLVRTEAEWAALVLRHLNDRDTTAFFEQILAWAGEAQDVRELNQWAAFAQNIWNNTPQPDRGGRTAYELAAEEPGDDLSLESWRT